MSFEAFPKVARLSRPCVVTEKIDGTNAQVHIAAAHEIPDMDPSFVLAQKDELLLFAGSRTRYIVPAADNFGFARWVKEHAEELWALGPGRHFGEWWGSGIQRGYGLPKGEKRFSLFNVARWGSDRPGCCYVVPVLAEGLFRSGLVEDALENLAQHGSYAAEGFMRPEGVVVWHDAARVLFKKTLEKDEEPKGKR